MPTIMGSQPPPNNFMAFDENSKISSTRNTLSKGHHKALRIPLYFLGSTENASNDVMSMVPVTANPYARARRSDERKDKTSTSTARNRSEERRVGKKWVRKCRSRGTP